MNVEAIVKRILMARPDLKEEQVMRLIEEEEGKHPPLLSREAIASIIASRLGVKLEGPTLKTDVKIRDLVPRLYDVSVVGRILLVYPIQDFRREDGTEGRVRRALLGDDTGMVDLVLWDKAAVLEESNLLGKVVRIAHAYTRSIPDGGVELHVGRRGEVILNPPTTEEVPEVDSFFKKIYDLKESDRFVNVVGALTKVFYSRELPSGGRVLRGVLSDETGKSIIVFWDGRAVEVEAIGPSNVLRIMNARLKRGGRGLEVHVDRKAFVTLLRDHPPIPKMRLKLSMLKDGMSSVDVLVRVADVSESTLIEDFNRSWIVVNDDTGALPLVLRDDKAELVRVLKGGEVILVEDGYVKLGKQGILRLNVGKHGKVTLNHEEEVPEMMITPIEKLREGFMASVEGCFKELIEATSVTTRKGDLVNVASFIIRDDTGEIMITVWRDLADVVGKLTKGDKLRITNLCVVRRRGELRMISTQLTDLNILSGDTIEFLV